MEDSKYDAYHLERRVEKLENEFRDLHETYAVNNQKIADALEHLSCLPAALQELQNSNVKIQHELSSNTKEINEIKVKMESIDEKSKFDIVAFLKSNWPWLTVLLVLGMGYAQNIKFI